MVESNNIMPTQLLKWKNLAPDVNKYFKLDAVHQQVALEAARAHLSSALRCYQSISNSLKMSALNNAAADLLLAVEHVLDASEDNGDMQDIDFNFLRAAVNKAKGLT